MEEFKFLLRSERYGFQNKIGEGGKVGNPGHLIFFLINILSCANKEKTRCLKGGEGGRGEVFSKNCFEARSGKTYCSKVFIKRGGGGG